MVYIVRQNRGRYIYYYECTSRRVEGRPHPVSDRVFIGRVDADTREFIPKSYVVKGFVNLEAGTESIRGMPRIPACYLPLAGVTS